MVGVVVFVCSVCVCVGAAFYFVVCSVYVVAVCMCVVAVCMCVYVCTPHICVYVCTCTLHAASAHRDTYI